MFIFFKFLSNWIWGKVFFLDSFVVFFVILFNFDNLWLMLDSLVIFFFIVINIIDFVWKSVVYFVIVFILLFLGRFWIIVMLSGGLLFNFFVVEKFIFLCWIFRVVK